MVFKKTALYKPLQQLLLVGVIVYTLLFLPIISALPKDADLSIDFIYPEPSIIEGANYSINVNNTEFHRGLTPQQVANLFVELDPYYFSNPRNYINVSPDLTPYWLSNGSSTATGNWNLGSKSLTTTGDINAGVFKSRYFRNPTDLTTYINLDYSLGAGTEYAQQVFAVDDKMLLSLMRNYIDFGGGMTIDDLQVILGSPDNTYTLAVWGLAYSFSLSYNKLSNIFDFFAPIRLYDNIKTYYGSSSDASIYYNTTDLIINPKEVGTGKVIVKGDLDVENLTADYFKGDGSLLTNVPSITLNGTQFAESSGIWNLNLTWLYNLFFDWLPIKNIVMNTSTDTTNDTMNVYLNGYEGTNLANKTIIEMNEGNVILSPNYPSHFTFFGEENAVLSTATDGGYEFGMGNGGSGLYTTHIPICDGVVYGISMTCKTSSTTGTWVNITTNDGAGNNVVSTCGVNNIATNQFTKLNDDCNVEFEKGKGIGFKVTASDAGANVCVVIGYGRCY
jgi:hypothetical protein